MGKTSILDTLKEKRKELKALKKQVKKLKKGQSKTDKKLLQGSVKDIKTLIKRTRKIQRKNSGFGDLFAKGMAIVKAGVKDGVAGAAVQTTVTVVGHFVDKYLNQGIEKELVDMTFTPPKLRWGVLSLEVSFGVGLSASIVGNSTIDTVTIDSSMSGNAWTQAALTLGFSFTIPIIKKEVSGDVTGGLKGTLYCDATVKLQLKAAGKNLEGSLSKTTVKTDFELIAFVEIPEWVVDLWNGAADWSFGKLDPLPSNEISKNIGRWEIFNIIIPGYDATFNMSSKKFEGKVNGSFSVTKGADVDALIKKIEGFLPW